MTCLWKLTINCFTFVLGLASMWTIMWTIRCKKWSGHFYLQSLVVYFQLVTLYCPSVKNGRI